MLHFPWVVHYFAINISISSWPGCVILLLQLSARSADSDGDAPGLFVDSGIHAREWVAHSTGVYTIYKVNLLLTACILWNLKMSRLLNFSSEHTKLEKVNCTVLRYYKPFISFYVYCNGMYWYLNVAAYLHVCTNAACNTVHISMFSQLRFELMWLVSPN